MADWTIALGDKDLEPLSKEEVLELTHQAVRNYKLDLQNVELSASLLRRLLRRALEISIDRDELALTLGVSLSFVEESAADEH